MTKKYKIIMNSSEDCYDVIVNLSTKQFYIFDKILDEIYEQKPKDGGYYPSIDIDEVVE